MRQILGRDGFPVPSAPEAAPLLGPFPLDTRHATLDTFLMLLQRVKKTIAEHGLLSRGDHVLVAVSGGADSVALVHVLKELAPPWDLRLTVGHLDHRIRGADARKDAAFVRSVADALGLSCVCGRSDVPRRAARNGVSLEMAAREARYAFFSRTAKRVGASCVATGHTADDQAETILLRAARGAGHRGLGGIAPVVVRKNSLRVIRPLLDVSRTQIESYLKRRHIAWREDASNDDRAFQRNRVRHEVLPLLESRLNPRVREALCRLAKIVREDEQWMDALADEILEAAQLDDGGLDLTALRTQDTAARRRVITRWLCRQGVDPSGIDFATAERVDSLLGGTRGSRCVDVPGGWVVQRRYDTMRAERSDRDRVAPPVTFREVIAVPGETIVSVPGLRITAERRPGIVKPARSRAGTLPASASLSSSAVGRRRLIVRNWKPADRIRPFGMRGSRKVQDIFVDAKVPRELRRHVPIVECAGEIVWIPGYRVGRGWEVEDPAAPAVQLRIERI